MITCHEALVVLIIADVIRNAIYANYYIKLNLKSIELRKRTTELEKKNGHEQHQIDELKQELAKLKKK